MCSAHDPIMHTHTRTRTDTHTHLKANPVSSLRSLYKGHKCPFNDANTLADSASDFEKTTRQQGVWVCISCCGEPSGLDLSLHAGHRKGMRKTIQYSQASEHVLFRCSKRRSVKLRRWISLTRSDPGSIPVVSASVKTLLALFDLLAGLFSVRVCPVTGDVTA